MLPKIPKLSKEFYSEHETLGHKEILSKENRHYAEGLLLTDLKNNYFVSFRSNISKDFEKRFPEAGMKLGMSNLSEGISEL